MPVSESTASQKELVRLLALEHGHKKASELSGVPYDVVRQWSVRGKWRASQSVTSPIKSTVDALASELADNERDTRLSLSRFAKRTAKESETATLKDAPNVHKAAQVAGIAFRWGSEDKSGDRITLNVLNMGDLDVSVGDEKS